jgi:hypothetical protein
MLVVMFKQTAFGGMLQEVVERPTQIDETGSKSSGYNGQSPRDGLSRGGSGEPGRSPWEGAPGDDLHRTTNEAPDLIDAYHWGRG